MGNMVQMGHLYFLGIVFCEHGSEHAGSTNVVSSGEFLSLPEGRCYIMHVVLFVS